MENQPDVTVNQADSDLIAGGVSRMKQPTTRKVSPLLASAIAASACGVVLSDIARKFGRVSRVKTLSDHKALDKAVQKRRRKLGARGVDWIFKWPRPEPALFGSQVTEQVEAGVRCECGGTLAAHPALKPGVLVCLQCL